MTVGVTGCLTTAALLAVEIVEEEVIAEAATEAAAAAAEAADRGDADVLWCRGYGLCAGWEGGAHGERGGARECQAGNGDRHLL